MSLNEFLLGFIGVVIGLGVADLLISFHKLLRAGSRVKWDWLTLLYAVYMLYSLIIMFWWQFGDPPAGATLTIWEFLPTFVYLATGFLMVASALPDDVPAEGIDLRVYYLETLGYRWSLFVVTRALNLLQGIYFNLILIDVTPKAIGVVVIYFLILVLAALAMRIRATWYQATLLILLFTLSSLINLFRPIGP
jgi:hypothetical protein